MDNLFGQIDLTLISRLMKEQPSLIKKVQFKDGEHMLLNVNVGLRQQPSNIGCTHYIRASVKRDDAVPGMKYYLGDLKPSTFGNNATAQTQQQQVQQAPPLPQVPPEPKDEDQFPF